MPTEVVWSTMAREALLEIYVHIGIENPIAAERIYGRIDQRVRQLVQQPRMGPRRPEIRPSSRVLVEAPYLILYETHPDTDDGPVTTVEIVNLVHGRRNLLTGE